MDTINTYHLFIMDAGYVTRSTYFQATEELARRYFALFQQGHPRWSMSKVEAPIITEDSVDQYQQELEEYSKLILQRQAIVTREKELYSKLMA